MKELLFKKGLALLLKAFPNKEICPEIAWSLLSDLTDEEFQKAVLTIISTKTDIYPGTNMIAMIREIAKEKSELTAGEAWAAVLKEVSRKGFYGKPTFDSVLIARAVECVGWKAICLSETIGVERAHFLKAYESLENRQQKETKSIVFSRTNQNGKEKIKELNII